MQTLATWSDLTPLRLAAAQSAEPSAERVSNVHDAAAMVEGLRRGDPAVMRRFFQIYSDKVERTLWHMLGPIDDLEDMVHDVFVDALDAIDRLRDPLALGSWVRGIAVIAVKRRLLKRYRRRWLSLTTTGELPDVPFTPRDVETREAFRSVHRILSQLHPEDRIAVILYRVDELTIDQAAQAMDISPSTFKRRLRRGEKRLLMLARKSAALRSWLGESEESV